MIYTRFGSEVEIIGGNIRKGFADWIRKSDGRTFRGYMLDLKADDGISEIEQAITEANHERAKNARKRSESMAHENGLVSETGR